MVQYKTHPPIQKQTTAHEHPDNKIKDNFYNVHSMGWKRATLTAAPFGSVYRPESRVRAKSDSPQALTAKPCLGHLALTTCRFDQLTERSPAARRCLYSTHQPYVTISILAQNQSDFNSAFPPALRSCLPSYRRWTQWEVISQSSDECFLSSIVIFWNEDIHKTFSTSQLGIMNSDK